MKCGRIGCNDYGKYQPIIRIKASILPADGKDILAVVRVPMTLCLRHKLDATQAEIIDTVPRVKMLRIFKEAKDKNKDTIKKNYKYSKF